MPPRISVVIASYQARRELTRLLDSLLRSDFTDFEVCVCDDASSDGTVEALRGYAGRLDIRWTVNTGNQGASFSRNEAARLSRAPLLLFLDADVRVYPDTISKLHRGLLLLKTDAIGGIYSDVALDDGVFSVYYALLKNHAFRAAGLVENYNVFNGYCCLSTRQALEAVGGWPPIKKGVEIECELVGRRFVARGFSIAMSPEICVDHHWGGFRKALFIFTSRTYWAVKILFCSKLRFEPALTTRAFALGTLAFPLSCFLLLSGRPLAAAAAVIPFIACYSPFFLDVLRKRPFFAPACVCLSGIFSFVIAGSGLYSAGEELFLRSVGRPTLDPRIFETHE